MHNINILCTDTYMNQSSKMPAMTEYFKLLTTQTKLAAYHLKITLTFTKCDI